MDMDCCWQSCLLQQLQGYVWVTIHRYHHAATRMAGQSACRETVQGGHWDCVPLGESILPPRDDHTPGIQKICQNRDANGARNKGRKVDLLHIWWSMAEDISVPQGATHVIDAICLLHGISVSLTLHSPSRLLCMVREKNTQGMHTSIRWNLVANMCHFNLSELYVVGPTRQSSSFSWKIGRKTRTGFTLDNQHCTQYSWLWITYPAPTSVQCVVQPDLEYSHEETDTQILFNTRILLCAKHASTKVTYYCIPLTLMSFGCVCLFNIAHAIHIQSTEIQPIALHQCDIYFMLPGSSSMFWPPRYRMHLFSGCDSTSWFLGHGKKTTRNISEKVLHFTVPWQPMEISLLCVIQCQMTGEV